MKENNKTNNQRSLFFTIGFNVMEFSISTNFHCQKKENFKKYLPIF